MSLEFQYRKWGAAYKETVTSTTYTTITLDSNDNGILHEIAVVANGDIPDFFSWSAFRETVKGHYDSCTNYVLTSIHCTCTYILIAWNQSLWSCG